MKVRYLGMHVTNDNTKCHCGGRQAKGSATVQLLQTFDQVIDGVRIIVAIGQIVETTDEIGNKLLAIKEGSKPVFELVEATVKPNPPKPDPGIQTPPTPPIVKPTPPEPKMVYWYVDDTKQAQAKEGSTEERYYNEKFTGLLGLNLETPLIFLHDEVREKEIIHYYLELTETHHMVYIDGALVKDHQSYWKDIDRQSLDMAKEEEYAAYITEIQNNYDFIRQENSGTPRHMVYKYFYKTRPTVKNVEVRYMVDGVARHTAVVPETEKDTYRNPDYAMNEYEATGLQPIFVETKHLEDGSIEHHFTEYVEVEFNFVEKELPDVRISY